MVGQVVEERYKLVELIASFRNKIFKAKNIQNEDYYVFKFVADKPEFEQEKDMILYLKRLVDKKSFAK